MTKQKKKRLEKTESSSWFVLEILVNINIALVLFYPIL
jgi:hypothetical protein